MSRWVSAVLLWGLGVLAGVVAIVWTLPAALLAHPRAHRVAVAMDQALNAALGGSPDETISSRAGKGMRAGVWRWCILCRLLDWVDPGHCQNAIEPDEGKPTPAMRRGSLFQGEGMARIKTGLWVAVGVFVAGVIAALTFRTAMAAIVATVLASVSGLAYAGAGGAGKAGAAVGGVHLPAFIGSLFGAALQWQQTQGRPKPERVLLAVVSMVAAYFGSLLTAELWPALGAGAVGLGGVIAANLAVPLIDALRVLLLAVRDALLALLHDIPWLRRLISSRLGAPDAAVQSPSTDTVDNSVQDHAGG